MKSEMMINQTEQHLPTTFRGLQFSSSTAPASVVELPTPQPATGSVILQPLYSNLVSYAKNVFCNGNPRNYNYPLPIVPGTNAIARVAAVATDTPHLKCGMLVYTSGVIRPRDNIWATPNLQGIQMGFTPEHEALMKGEWRNGCWAELVKVPAENVHILNERRLTEELGYDLQDLGYLSTLAVAYGGLDDVNLCPGETVVVAPATGNFGSAAVQVALAMGAGKVIAMGRNLEKLEQLLESDRRVTTVAISGDINQELTDLQDRGPVDVYFDISTNLEHKPSYVQAAITSLRPGGRISIMGGFAGNLELPYIMIMYKGITIKGTFMYTREQAERLIKLVESGLLPIGKRGGIQVTGSFRLEQWQEAFEHAFNCIGPKKVAYFKPNEG
jgi:threonine dehydrogenase-like Zn-dependent dehydrogenase